MPRHCLSCHPQRLLPRKIPDQDLTQLFRLLSVQHQHLILRKPWGWRNWWQLRPSGRPSRWKSRDMVRAKGLVGLVWGLDGMVGLVGLDGCTGGEEVRTLLWRVEGGWRGWVARCCWCLPTLSFILARCRCALPSLSLVLVDYIWGCLSPRHLIFEMMICSMLKLNQNSNSEETQK